MPEYATINNLKLKMMEILEEAEEQAAIEKGCDRCGGEVGGKATRYIVTMQHPCSEGSVRHIYVLCGKCYDLVGGILERKDKPCQENSQS